MFNRGVDAQIWRTEKVRGPIANPHWVLVLFLLGTIVDYGGGLYVKHAVFALALIYLLTQRRAYSIWLHCLPDLAVFILIPAGITMGHLLLSPGLDFENVFGELWRLLGTPSYFIVVPLIYFVGAERTANWLVVILTTLALATVLLMVAHLIGIINIFEYSEFMMSHRLALFGTDTRGVEMGVANIGLPGFGAAQAFPVGFSLALASNPVFVVILAAAIILGTQRGQTLGLLFALCLMMVQMKGRILAGLRKMPRVSRGVIKVFVLVGLLIGAVGVAIAFYMGDMISVLLYKYELFASLQDESSSIRLSHIAGYWQCVKEAPLGLLWGFGPIAHIYNAVLGEQIFMTEMVILMYLFWYGWIYSIIFLSWIGFGLWDLLRHSRKRFDAALVTALIVLLIIGNINPIMLTPLAFIFLALFRVRRLELYIK